MLHDLYFRLRSLLHLQKAESELDEELRFHCERQTEKYIEAGMSREEAQRRARLMFGGLDWVKEECREARGISFFETLVQDARYALRLFRKSPAFTATAILTLALGIGANTAIFSMVEGVVLKPLPYPHPEQLVSIGIAPLALDPTLRGVAGEDYFIFREQGRTFEDIGIYVDTDSDRDVNVTGMAEPERVHAAYVSDGILSVLGVPAMHGRIFSRADDSPSSPPTAILTYGYWQRRFNGDPSVIGKTIVTDGKAREIVGVMPRNFRFLDLQDLSLLLPIQLDRNTVKLGNFIYYGIGRLRPGSTLHDAEADLARPSQSPCIPSPRRPDFPLICYRKRVSLPASFLSSN